MPLTEFLRMSKGRMDATQQRSSLSSDPSCRPETDFVELVWENGQIMMQGQSNNNNNNNNNNKPRKICSIPNNNIQTLASKPQEIRFNPNGSKMVKFSMMDDNSLSEMGLDHDAEMVSWLNYPFEETLQNEYPSDFLRELSGVTINDFSNEKHGNPHQGFVAPPSSVPKKHKQGESSEVQVPHFSPAFQHHNNNNSNIPTSGVSAITGSNNNRSSHCNTSGLRLHAGGQQPSTSSGFTNFPCISRHAVLAKRMQVNSSNVCCEKDVGSHNNNSQSAPQAPINNGNLESCPPAKPAEEVFSSNQAKSSREDVVAKNDVAKHGERNVEPAAVAASSVCSGNSVERTSSDLKRKSRETESEGPSEEFEEESVGGARKPPSNRTGSKRTRAAEVHNLSERRRRDRINEKMRALQELIPNCNKVDKASMLDEAIEYLKTLQLQVQMLAMGAGGLYMQPMMLPPGIQGAPHMPHFSPMMGLGMGYGFNMLDINGGGGMKMMPFQGPHYGIPGVGPAFPAMPGSSLHTFGRPSQGLPMAIHHRAPILAGPTPTIPPLNVNVPALGLSVSGVAGSTIAPPLALAPNQPTTEVTENHSVDQAQGSDHAKVAVASSGTDAMPS